MGICFKKLSTIFFRPAKSHMKLFV